MSYNTYIEWTLSTIDDPMVLFSNTSSEQENTGTTNSSSPQSTNYCFIKYSEYVQQTTQTGFFYPCNQFNVVSCPTQFTIPENNDSYYLKIQGASYNNYYIPSLVWFRKNNNLLFYELATTLYQTLYKGSFTGIKSAAPAPNYSNCFGINVTQNTTQNGNILTTILAIFSTPYSDSECYDQMTWNLQKVVVFIGNNVTYSSFSDTNFISNNSVYIRNLFEKYTNVLGKDIPTLDRCFLRL